MATETERAEQSDTPADRARQAIEAICRIMAALDDEAQPIAERALAELVKPGAVLERFDAVQRALAEAAR